ncbi:glycosyltransferase family protein [Aliarcobacter butzleri]|uniref:glycosyltransferase family protein n=1 Tax=Aliarcobacter butzleri TaxID=28197 RepID=UPI0012FBECE0|nr:glycosyltransferase [Aliarcobacter butzleri]
MNILIYKGIFQYDVVNMFIDNTIYFLEKKGHNVIIVDEKKEKNNTLNKILETFSNTLVDVVIDFGAIGSHIKFNNECVYNITNSLYLAVIVDHPAYHIQKLSENIKNFLCCFNDKQHVIYANEILPNHHKISFFLPHGGLKKTFEEDSKINNISKYKKQKSIDIVFAGTYQENIDKKWAEENGFPKYILDETCEKLINDDYGSVHQTFNNICDKYGIKFSTFGKVQLSSILIKIIDYVRNFKRIEVIKYILKNDLNITICGNGWENFVKKHKNINYVGALDIKDTIKLINKAKVLINVTPNFTDGSHERVFTGMLNHTIVFSDKSRYYNEFFEDEKNILYYSFNRLDDDIKKLKEILKDDEKLFSMSQNAYEITEKYHTWENRVNAILDMINLSKLMDK